ncbi:hypothetical protein TRAPUB_11766 [Trametes pubescens]|uniref:Fungal-type protein kinase domain-containing protein n=1 Tax=Trametes pubescens TaxID=154538 RepID=A0A1M2VVR9_TRAPU|nr:hypothetical protein TRAPUB_11766 [Trametes pubescens]
MATTPPPTPLVYISNQQSSPSNLKNWNTVNPNKLGISVANNAELDRQLEVWDSMDRSLLTTLDEFENNILWPHANGDIPEPPQKAVKMMSKVIDKLFYTAAKKRRQDVPENEIANAIINDVIKEIGLPNELSAALSQDGYNATDPAKSKVDAALYPSGAVPEDGCPDWTHLRLFIEFKKGGTEHDPFNDKGDHPEAWAKSRQRVRGQLLAYASTTFQYQHRTALYSLLINGDEFRGMYWDRSGLIVTEATNYVDDPSLLVRFLWTFASLSDERQGIDPTATLLSTTSDEYKLMDSWAIANPALDMPFHELANVSEFPDAVSTASLNPAGSTRQRSKQPTHPVFKFVRDLFRDSLVLGWPRYKLDIGEGPGKREFLVAKPVFMSTSMFGRGTRGYIACDLETNQFIWLKDSWRPFYEGVEPEGNYLEMMASKPGLKLIVPTVVAHGDVLRQTTSVAEYYKADQSQSTTPSAEVQSAENQSAEVQSVEVQSVESARGKKRAREEEEASEEPDEPTESRTFIHYRLAVKEVCMNMGNFKQGKQLVRMILDCIYTHADAYVHFNLLHRDVSSGNMLIMPYVEKGVTGLRRVRWKGFLTDWELAKYVPKDKSLQRARQPERTGTWQFMSVAYVRDPGRPVAIADELESFFHVLLHHSIRYLGHSFHDTVTSFIIDYFDTFQRFRDNTTRCSMAKVRAVTDGRISIDDQVLEFNPEVDSKGKLQQHPLNDLLKKWLVLFNARYDLFEQQRRELRASRAVTNLSPGGASSRVEAEEDVEDLASAFPVGEFPDIVTTRYSLIDLDTPDDDAASAEATVARMKAENAAELEDHIKTIKIFENYIKTRQWPLHDVVADQLDSTYNPKKQFAAAKSAMMVNVTSGHTSTLSKRARTDTSTDVASGSRPTTTTQSPPHREPMWPLIKFRARLG